jgi:hypothetical protein
MSAWNIGTVPFHWNLGTQCYQREMEAAQANTATHYGGVSGYCHKGPGLYS